MFKSIFISAAVFILSTHANAATKSIRWTGADDPVADLGHVLTVLSQKAGAQFRESDFLLQDSRDLAFTRYERFEQLKSGDPINQRSLRLWTDRQTGRLVQAEATLDVPGEQERMSERVVLAAERLTDAETFRIARATIAKGSDPTFRGLEFKDRWQDGRFVRLVTVRGKRGETTFMIHHRTRQVSAVKYQGFPQADLARRDRIATQSLQALVYPIYEETEDLSARLERVPATLDHLLTEVADVPADLYAPLRKRRYFYSLHSPVLGATEAGRAQGYWSMSWLKEEAAKLRAGLPLVANDFNRGLLLQGLYATINIHPDAFKRFSGIDFTPAAAPALLPNWVPSGEDYEIVLGNAFYGKPIRSAGEALSRPARRLEDHSPAAYLNDGFDELQVYYAINKMFDTLRANGFSDPELSTRAFHAFLFNPDIEYRDNAFYTDDTINFTTYSPKSQNYARDNSTIWHELGHGVMDRLMGDNLTLADSGGLSEGMADFVAAIIIQSATQGVPFPGSDQFRIINRTGFSLTNESHDDGEAYGGAMKDLMDAVVLADRERGLEKVTDVILEAMRLCRDHPALDANVWFNHVLFADSLGRAGLRQPGELKSIILAALNGRNFRLDGGQVASMRLYNARSGQDIEVNTEGARYSPMALPLKPEEKASVELGLQLKSSSAYAFKYPVTVKIGFVEHALQGSVHWVGEEKGPQVQVLNSEADSLRIPLEVTGTCDAINREDGTCSDYVYVQVFNNGESRHAIAKKRFYVHIKKR